MWCTCGNPLKTEHAFALFFWGSMLMKQSHPQHIALCSRCYDSIIGTLPCKCNYCHCISSMLAVVTLSTQARKSSTCCMMLFLKSSSAALFFSYSSNFSTYTSHNFQHGLPECSCHWFTLSRFIVSARAILNIFCLQCSRHDRTQALRSLRFASHSASRSRGFCNEG